MEEIRLTQYSHGAGCGCKLSPAVLDGILNHVGKQTAVNNLLVGNHTKDDAAVMDLGDGTAIISTTDFFMPIVDDPADFGRIAATNAISDIYAMGGEPLMAIAILGWPIDKIDTKYAGAMLEGGREVCATAGIPLAGGHSIDCPEPLFGLAVTGRVAIKHLKQNNTARPGDVLFLTKGLGVGIITTAQKRGLASSEDVKRAVESMQTLNSIGADLGKMPEVHALTDVTGFGLLGHLVEMCQGSELSAKLNFESIPQLLPGRLKHYHNLGAVPGGTKRNFQSYGHHCKVEGGFVQDLLTDPQTSGGLLIAVHPEAQNEVIRLGLKYGIELQPIGELFEQTELVVQVY
jgi:selenide,water dikinase